MFGVAHNLAFTHRNQAYDIRDMSLQLGVHYVIKGNVRPAQERVRVASQLIDAVTTGLIFAENFDAPLDPQLEVQSQSAKAIVAALAAQIDGAKSARAQTG
jgi:adenylate cyclase